MKVVRLHQPASLAQLRLTSAEPRPPNPGEVLVRVHASSLNYHDYAVVTGQIPSMASPVNTRLCPLRR
jgi:NADPH:quinone reductase-like Zn-dependent oxidoreductase